MRIPSVSKRPALELKSIKIYSTGYKGKIFTEHIYKSKNHNFGIEISIQNNTSSSKDVKVGGCVYDNFDNIVARWNTTMIINPHTSNATDFYITHDKFARLHVGTYHMRFWINDKRMPIKYFEITNF